jgi:mannose-6-phosphate isomerase-like protein (cupin superfamily)
MRSSSHRFGSTELGRAIASPNRKPHQIVLEPGQRGRIHRHQREEEVYLVLEGQLDILVDGEESELGAGELFRVAPVEGS